MNTFSRILLLATLLAGAGSAQDFRATILGQVVDPSRAAIANASVEAIKEDTNVKTTTVTNAEGIYTLVGLVPGTYTVTVSATGFTALRRTGIVLQVAEKLNLPFSLEVGVRAEAVTVTGDQEIIQTATASRGLVLDPTKMEELPLPGRTVFMLMQLSPGVVFTQRVFGPSGYSEHSAWAMFGGFTMNGGRSGTNQFLLNGAPISTEGQYNVLPNIDAIEEMKVMVNTYDAQYGRSGGGHASTTMRSGTNQWHGSVVDVWRNRVLDANSRQNNAGGQRRGFRNQHQFSGVVGGPVRKNRDFIFASVEGWRARLPFPSVSTVPPASIRNGDFNFVPAGLNGPIQVYDQLTSVPCTNPGVSCTSGGLYARQLFPGNIIPASRVSPVGKAILNLYPLPNLNATSLTNNYLRPDNVGRYRYEQPMGRWDHIFPGNDRLSVVFQYFDGTEWRNSNGFNPPAATGDLNSHRRNWTSIISYDKTLSPTRILHLQTSFNRFIQNFPRFSDPNFTWDKLGIKNIPEVPTFPTKLAPQVVASGYSTIMSSEFAGESSRQQINLQGNISQTIGRHSFKYGAEVAQLIHHSRASGNASGQWTFDTVWSRHYYGRRESSPLDGNAAADLLLGYMNSGNVPYNDSNLRREPYIAGYFQDDWRVSNRLTLNLGLRYDLQFPMYEIHDRLVAGFDFNAVSPISDQALANWRKYAAATPGYPAPPSAIKGGLVYAGVGGQPRRIYDFDKSNIQPRVGFAYNFLSKTVMRGGFGIFHRTLLGAVVNTGFSQTTDFINSINGGLNHRAGVAGPYSLENAFPDGLIQPLGSKGGLLTSLGTGITFGGRQRPIPRTFEWSYTLERQLPWNMVLEVSYVGSKTVKEPMSINLSDASQKDWQAAGADPFYFQQTVPNPWYGVAATNTALGASATISRRDLLRRIPQFPGVTMQDNPWGRVWYHGMQVRYEKRMMSAQSRSGALTWVTSYTWSKAMERALRQNFTFEWMPFINQVTSDDRSHNLNFSFVWDVPVGRNRAFFSGMGKVADAVLGGWTANSTLRYQSGVPLGSWSGWEYLCGDPLAVDRGENRWWDNRRSCYRQLGPYDLVQLPARFHQIRSYSAPQLDIAVSKHLKMTERYQIEFRGEAFNATNSPLRGDPTSGNPSAADFGVLPVQQLNFPRGIALTLRFRF